VEDSQPDARLRLVWADLRALQETTDLAASAEPDVIFHLAAQSIPAVSFGDPWATLETNIRCQLNILEAVRRLGRPTRVLVIGSNEEYGGPRPEDLPLTEETPLRPASPYAVSKVTQDYLGLQYHLTYKLDVVRLRPFNHTGPGQSPNFVVPAFASQIARIETGLQEPVVRVGNLDVWRDFSDVRDIVRAYYLAAVKAEAGQVYNLASGQPQKVRDLLDRLLALSETAIRVEVDPARYRPAGAPMIYGSAARFCQQTGWEPEIPFEQTLADVLGYWRGQVGK
jgi:GDP-4-dehydro-6-deoxy-D-mannose reductase